MESGALADFDSVHEAVMLMLAETVPVLDKLRLLLSVAELVTVRTHDSLRLGLNDVEAEALAVPPVVADIDPDFVWLDSIVLVGLSDALIDQLLLTTTV